MNRVTSDRPVRARVLVADDDERNRQLLGEVCAAEGYEVDSVGDGRAALELASTVRFDLALLDVSMPELNGYEVLERLRSDPRTAGLPVIIVTAHPHDDGRRRAFELGAFGHIEKPFRIFDLTQRMRLALRKPRGDGEPSTMPHVRVRRALGDVLPHLPAPSELRPSIRRAVDEAWASGRQICCAALRFDAGPRVLSELGRTARDAALGAMIVHLGTSVLGPVHRADDDELVFLASPDFCELLPALLGELSGAAADALDRAPRDLPVSLGVVILPPRSKRPDVDAVLRATRGVAGRASGAKPPVVVEVYVPTDSA